MNLTNFCDKSRFISLGDDGLLKSTEHKLFDEVTLEF